MDRFIAELRRLLDAGQSVVLATVVGQAGSTPRAPGARMAVLPDGALTGSVGGGLLEAEVVRLALEVHERGGARLYAFDLTGDQADHLDMTCGGAAMVFIERLEADGETRALYAALAEELFAGRAATLVAEFAGSPESLRLSAKTLSRNAEIKLTSPVHLERFTGGVRLSETFPAPFDLHVAGAGHVGFFTARLAALAGFRVSVLDDRPEFANPERFPEAHHVRALASFAHCFERELGASDFVAILTRGHRHDTEVLAQALAGRAGYVGMIGSARKRQAAFAVLHSKGFSPAELARVHCPIGLRIGAQTPEEIAVSIVAELIQVRSLLAR